MSFFQILTYVYQNHARTVEHAPRTPLTIIARVHQAIQERTVRIVRNAHLFCFITEQKKDLVSGYKRTKEVFYSIAISS